MASTDSASKKTSPGLFICACLMVLAMIFFGVWDSETLSSYIADVNALIYTYFGSFYLWFVFIVLIGLVILGVSPLGKIRLGGPDSKPKHSYFSWFSMLFNAGMGTGIMFWGSAEPLQHFTHPPVADATMTVLQQQQMALAYTFFHWGFSPWALYALSAIAIGFFGFNLQKGFRFSSFLINDDPDKPEVRGKKSFAFIIDLVTIMAVVFGVASSIGMGTLSLEGGLESLAGIHQSWMVELGLIVVMTVIYLISACNGLEKGIKFLSNLCLWLALVVLACLIVTGPTLHMMQGLWSGMVMYFTNMPAMSLGVGADPDWVGGWTIMYWSWWIAWAPFVGIFVALISHGRTIRQVIMTVMVAPTLFSCVWFAVMGTAAIDYQMSTGFPEVALTLSHAHEIMFRVLDIYVGTPLISWLSLLIVVIFIANSADSAAYTISCLSCTDNCSREVVKKPDNNHIMGWGILFALLAAVLLISGGIGLLEDVTTITVLPFAALMVFIFFTLIKDMIRYDNLERKAQKKLADDAAASLEQLVEAAEA